jgi:RNA polymerase sigma factor (sigma-70 family)
MLELTNYALHRIWSLKWILPADTLPKGLQAQDLAKEAIKKVYSGERQWDPARNPDLVKYLKGIVKSDIGHLVRSPDHSVQRDSGESQSDGIGSCCDPNPTPEERLGAIELKRRILDCVSEEDGLRPVLLGLLKGKKPRELASELGCDRNEIYARVKKIRRWLRSAKLRIGN